MKIWVFAESENSNPTTATLEMVTKARELGGTIEAVYVGTDADAVATGLVDIGSHTHSHALLDRLDPQHIASELDTSIGLIGDRLGVSARHFAYPKAVEGSPAAKTAVRERFASAAVAGTRPNPYGRTDPYRVARSPIQHADGMRWFERKVSGGMRFEDDVRRVLNRVRYAGATT